MGKSPSQGIRERTRGKKQGLLGMVTRYHLATKYRSDCKGWSRQPYRSMRGKANGPTSNTPRQETIPMATKTKSKKASSKASKTKAAKPAPEQMVEQPEPETQTTPVDQLTKLWWDIKPEKEEVGTALWIHFVSECGRYQLSRIDSQVRNSVVWAACYLKGEGDNKAWDTMFSTDVPQHAPLFYKTAEAALAVIESYHCDRMKVHMDKVKTNRDDLLGSVAELPAPIHQGREKPSKTSRGKQDPRIKRDATESNQTQDGQPEKSNNGHSPRQPRQVGQPSNKEKVYRAWQADANTATDQYAKIVGDQVKMSTVKSWISSWKRGQNLPGCATS